MPVLPLIAIPFNSSRTPVEGHISIAHSMQSGLTCQSTYLSRVNRWKKKGKLFLRFQHQILCLYLCKEKKKSKLNMGITLRNSIQSFPMHRDLKTLTALFHEEAANLATWYDISSEKRKLETGIFSIL